MVGSLFSEDAFLRQRPIARRVRPSWHNSKSNAKIEANTTSVRLHRVSTISSEEALWNNLLKNDKDKEKRNTLFCALWTVDVDDWWSQHPTWELAFQNTTHQCFQKISNNSKSNLYQRLYSIQLPESCNEVISKYITGSGWGVDISHAIDGLLTALSHKGTVHVIAPTPWQYASGVHGSAPMAACPRADLSCYFLPLSGCDAQPRDMNNDLGGTKIRYEQQWRGFAPQPYFGHHADDNAAMMTMNWTVPWLLQYATRSQTWLRRRVVQAVETVHLPSTEAGEPCTVIHVRRADVVLHGKFSRRYHAIYEYVDALEQTYGGAPTERHNVLLLSDDANAIREAITQYPVDKTNYQWFYLDRERHEADSGGWENQIPSGDPVTEVVMLLAAFELASQCQTLVHSKSNLADYLYATMLLQQENGVVRIDLDEGRPHQQIHQASNADTVRLSKGFG